MARSVEQPRDFPWKMEKEALELFSGIFSLTVFGESSAPRCVQLEFMIPKKKKKKSGNSALELPEWEFFPDQTDGAWQSK